MGMMASVRVSFTMVALSSVFAPGCMPSHAAAAAVTEDVSLTAVPANRPKPWFDRPSAMPRAGNTSAAITLNRKMTEIDCAISSSSASMTGAVAAMAEPPQMEEPTVRRELQGGTLREIPLCGCEISHDFTFLWWKNSVFAEEYHALFELLRP